METGFDIYESALTNEEVSITYTPALNTRAYTYEIIKDGEVYASYTIPSSSPSQIYLYESGTYQISVTITDRYNKKTEEVSGIYVLDLGVPTITCDSSVITIMKTKDVESIKEQVTSSCRAIDGVDGDISSNLTVDINSINSEQIGLQTLTLSVSDTAGNVTTKDINLNIRKDNSASLLGFQIILIFITIYALYRFIKYRKSIAYEKRLTKYSVKEVYDRRVSIMDAFVRQYENLITRVSNVLMKSSILRKTSQKYEKYIPLYKETYKEAMNFISVKLLVAILFVIIAIFSKTLQFEVLEIYEVFLPFIFGYILPDIIYMTRYKIHRTQIENDLLQAIIIMNNAFKSGRSITQAVELVTKELDGPIAEEFKKMHLEISFGLAIDVVFKRFAERIELEEVTYLTASLSILNKTGGNIIKVFDTIEKTLFNKKKLKLELLSLTGSSKIIVYMLIAIPILFVLFISMISPTYFVPLISSPIGWMITGIIIVIYILYIICVQKIMKVRM